MRYFLLLFIIAVLASCSDSSSTSSTENENTPATPAPQSPAPTAQNQEQEGTLYPSISRETMEMLWEECNYIDYAFTSEKIPYSMSINEKSSIQQTLGLLSTTPALVRDDCQSIGRMYFQKDGENLMEVDLYFFGEGCKYWVFLEDGKPTYANYLTPDGVAYYERFFNQTNVSQ